MLSVLWSENSKSWAKQHELNCIEEVTVEKSGISVELQDTLEEPAYLFPLPFLPTITLCFGLQEHQNGERPLVCAAKYNYLPE